MPLKAHVRPKTPVARSERYGSLGLRREVVAFRRCSFTGCSHITVGPSDEAPDAHANIGEAAHICAAAPGGRRYVLTMTPDERAHIDNAIWLCVHHSRLIDRDEATYTAEVLRRMKQGHESACAEELRRLSGQPTGSFDLIALGPGIICTGDLLGVDGSEWSLQLRNFVKGDIHALIRFFEECPVLPKFDRYVLVNALGDGRVLSAPPSLLRSDVGYTVRCPVESSFPRTNAHRLGSQWAMSPETGDLYLDKGQIARVSGLPSLPQLLRQTLSLQRGESPLHTTFGARFSEYFDDFCDSPWLDRLLKLELVRQASIPYSDELLHREYTPLQTVERVHSIEVIGTKSSKNWLPVRVDLDVNGVGRWQADFSILIPSEPGRV